MTPEPLKVLHIFHCDMCCDDTEKRVAVHEIRSRATGLIKSHEDRIEELIKELITYGTQMFEGDSIPYVHEKYIDLKMMQIRQEYESIMAIEHWFWDAI